MADVPGLDKGIRLRDSLVDFLSGSITAPGAFESFIRKVAKNLNGMSADATGSCPGDRALSPLSGRAPSA